MSAQRDPELDDLFEDDPELRQLAQLIRARPHPAASVEPSPNFHSVLKQRLMREAWERVSQPQLPWYRRALAPQPLAWAGAAVGALLIVFAAWSFAATPGGTHSTVKVSSTLSGNTLLLSFNQPMDTSSVQHAVHIVPATEVTYNWADNQHLAVTALHNLTPNTQYVVTIEKTARTQDGQPVAHTPPVQFVTSPPPPTPTPTPSSSPSSPPTPPITGLHDVAPVGAPAARWSPDGTKIYIVGPSGQLGAWPTQGGASTSVQPDGVSLVAVALDGAVAYFRDGQITYGPVTVTGVQPIALGFGQSGLVFATASDVEASDQHKLATFAEQATSADISPAGDRLVYRSSSGNLHLVNLTSGKDSAVGPSAGLGDWSPDGTKYAYQTDAGVFVADTSSATSSRLLEFPGLTGLSWSHGNQLLLSTSSALSLYTPGDPAGARKLAADQFERARAPSWAPTAGGYFAFRRGGELWIGKVSGAQLSIGPPGTAGPNQDDVVNGFMTARQNQQADQAGAYLDQAGKDAFSSAGLSLTYAGTGSTLRYYTLLSQSGKVVVRLVLTKGNAQSVVDETLTLKSSGGKLLIDGVSDRPRTSFGAGPEIVRVTVAGDQVQVFFDSDLDQSTVQGSVTIKGANGQAVSSQANYDPRSKAVLLPAGGLSSGATYEIAVGAGLRDTPNGRQAVPYQLQFLGP